MRNVIVSGGSRGLGLAICRRLSQAGYRVIALARRCTAEFDQAVTEAAPGELHFVAFDLNDIGAMPELIKSIRRDHGPIYGLVNNAGIGTAGVLAAMPLDKIEELIRLNTLSPIALTRQAMRSMLSESTGRIINMSSIIASTGYSGLSVYAATKGALNAFTRSLAREAGRAGITVNAVAPGFIDTALTSEMTDEQRQQIGHRSALRRLAEPDDVARVVEFLLGDGGRNITGTITTIDAGNSA